MPRMQAMRTVAELATSQPLNGDFAYVAGYHSPGDGGAGHFIFDATAEDQIDNGLVFASAHSQGRWRRVLDHPGMVSVRWWGARGDGQTDDLEAFKQALVAIRPPAGTPAYLSRSGGKIIVPYSVQGYRLSSPLYVTMRVMIEGIGGQRHAASRLVFDAGGLVIEHSGEQSVVRDLKVEGAVGHTGDLVTLYGRATLERVYAQFAGGHGIRVDGSSGPSGEHRNCNQVRMVDCGGLNCGGDGLYIHGDDANAGLYELFEGSFNDGAGLRDNGFLGNTHISHHVSVNEEAAYVAENPASRSLWLRPYSELGQTETRILHPSIIVGGTHGAPQTGDALTIYDRLRTTPSMTVESSSADGQHVVQVTLGGGGGKNALTWRVMADPNTGQHTWAQGLTYFGATGRWYLTRANSPMAPHLVFSFDDARINDGRAYFRGGLAPALVVG